ncbi:MAG TPA: sulfatase [Bryobacteraceae bacterium]|nr:sulfatase [Bryobacteraceae bacterium]
MDRRDAVKSIVSGLATLPAAAQAQPARPRPNILYLHSHDTGRHIEPYGYDVSTPNLRKFAEEAVLFRHAFDAAPTCSPSRASLLTGQCPHSNGMLGLAHRGFALNDYRQHIVHTLRGQAGYRSTLIGVQHVAQPAAKIGYDEIVPIKNTHAAHVGPAAVQWLKNGPKQPFFLDIGFQETHREFAAPGPKDDPRYCVPPEPLPDTPQTRLDIASFHATARILDQAMGDILRALEAAGLAQNTLVICTTDHGIAFPEMKCDLSHHGTGVMLMMRGPGGFSGGKVSDALVSQIDIFPTVCDLLEIDHPKWLQGKSMMPLIRGTRQEINDEIFAEVNYHAAYEPKRSVRTKRWSYMRNYDERRRPVLPNCDDGPSKDVWLEFGWRDRVVPPEQLYDLIFDPEERRNLAMDAALGKTLNEMRGRLDAWMRRTGDPLLKGPVKAPPGAQVNDSDSISPREKTIPAV